MLDAYGCEVNYTIQIADPTPPLLQYSPSLPMTSVVLPGGSPALDAAINVQSSVSSIQSFFLVDATINGSICYDSDTAWSTNTNVGVYLLCFIISIFIDSIRFTSESGTFAGLPSGYLSLYVLTEGNCLVEYPTIINVVTPSGMIFFCIAAE